MKNVPVAPSAWNHVVDGIVMPCDSCPALNIGVPKYIARSAMPSSVNVTFVQNERFRTPGMSPA